MKRGRTIAAGVLLAGLVLTRALAPELGAGAREYLRKSLERETEAVAAFRSIGDALDLRGTEAPSAGEDTAPAPQQTRTPKAFVSYVIEEGDTQDTPTPEPTEPASVAAFLTQQADFADMTLPENAVYDYVPLPFDYVLPVAGRHSSGFGFRLHPILNVVRFHFGTDVAADAGETIAAFADGRVCFTGRDDSFGWHLKIDHGDGWISHYCHCSGLLAREGDAVSAGDAVALVGATGLATGPHLHFELSHDGVYVNPEYYLNV